MNSGDGDDLGLIGQEVDELRQIAGRKPVFAFIESGAYDASNPVITPDQFRGEVWEAIIHGARGIFYGRPGRLSRRVSPIHRSAECPRTVTARFDPE